jgi:hypothetical protein
MSVQANLNQAHHPQSWCLEVSNDGEEWAKVQECPDNNGLNGFNLVGTYHIDNRVKSRFVRLRQAGKNHLNNDHFFLSSFEIYGVLQEL